MVTTRGTTTRPRPGSADGAPRNRTGGPRPRRRPSRRVIWRRRVVALLVLLGMLAGAVWGGIALADLASGWIGETLADDEPAETEVAGADEGETAPPGPGPCSPADLDVTLAPAAAPGSTEFALTITNESDAACLVDTGSESLVLTVHSGEDRIWSSADCPTGSAEHLLLLDSGDSADATVTWDGTRSEPGCTGGRSAMGSGTYRVSTTVDGAIVPTAEATFTR